MSFLTAGLSGLGALLGFGSPSTTPTAAGVLPTLAGLNPRPYATDAGQAYATPIYASPIYGANSGYQAAGYANQMQPAPTQAACSIDFFSYTTIVPLAEVVRTHDVTRVVNTTVYLPIATTTTIVDVETVIIRQGGTPSIVIAQTTNCANGFPAWQTAVQPQQPQQYQPVYHPTDSSAGDDRYPAYRANQGDENYQPYYGAPKPASTTTRKKHTTTSSDSPWRLWVQATQAVQDPAQSDSSDN